MTHNVELYWSSVSYQYIGAPDIYFSWFLRVIYWTSGRLKTFEGKGKKMEGNQLYVLGHQSVNKALNRCPWEQFIIFYLPHCEGTFSGFFLEDVDTRWCDCDRLLILNTLTTWRWCLLGVHNIVYLAISNVFQLLLADYRYMDVYFSPNCGKHQVTLVMESTYYTYHLMSQWPIKRKHNLTF